MLKMRTKPRRKQIRVGPQDNGRKMSLADFDKAVAQEGYLYELGKGVIEVSDVPHPSHFAPLQRVRNELILYQAANPEIINAVTGSNDSKILLESDQSERHPDISVYLTAPPDNKDIWSTWIPAIVVEVVSKSSIERDYEVKPGEYLVFGIDEYWIVDGLKLQMTVHTRWRGRWKTRVLKSTQKCSPLCLPGFTLELKRVFAATK
jgi:Uma2 family endonuclease